MSASGEFSSRDLYGFQCCVRDFDLLLERWKREPSDLAVRYSVVKAFELTFQMAVKTLIKYLEATSRRGDEVANFDFQDVIRLAQMEILSGEQEQGGAHVSRGDCGCCNRGFTRVCGGRTCSPR
jgi:hypothetical protein